MIYRRLLAPSMFITCALIVQSALATADERPCRADIRKYCTDVKPGGGRVAECLRKHQEELSTECKARGQEVRERIQ